MDTIDYRGCKIEIHQDTDADSPRDWDNVGTMVCWHRRYKLGDLQPGEQPYAVIHDLAHSAQPLLDEDTERDDYEKLVQCALDDHYVILPLYLYDHSGITMSTGSFSCAWDSGQVGFIYCTKVKAIKECGSVDKAIECLKGEVETYAAYLEGNVYGYVTKGFDGENIDSCWGFVGDQEYMIGEAKGSIDHYIAEYGTRGDVSGEHDTVVMETEE